MKKYVKYFELNISCPNIIATEAFINPVRFEKFRGNPGLVIPIPTFPFLSMVKALWRIDGLSPLPTWNKRSVGKGLAG